MKKKFWSVVALMWTGLAALIVWSALRENQHLATLEAEAAHSLWGEIFGMVIVTLIVGSILSLALIWIMRDTYAKLGGDPKHVRDVVERIAEGDLANPVRLKVGDSTSLLTALEKMRVRMADALDGVQHAGTAISAGTKQLKSGNEELSSRTEQQSASIEETAASMEQLTQTVRQNTDNARQASSLASQASNNATETGARMDRVSDTMSQITESSRKMTEIIELIDSIAFQTNILALNASVEAARAGEQGRGFSVVANEVRSLASRSANASSDIRALLETSSQQISRGSAVVKEAGQSVRLAVESNERMNTLMQEITSASEEQSSGIEEVNTAIGQLEQVTQQNSRLVQEANTATTLLRDQAGLLEEKISWFRLSQSIRERAADTDASYTRKNDLPALSPTRTSAADNPRKSESGTPDSASRTSTDSAQKNVKRSQGEKAKPQEKPQEEEWEVF